MGENENKNTIEISKNKYRAIQNVLENLHESLGRVIELMEADGDGGEALSTLEIMTEKMEEAHEAFATQEVHEGVFDGQKMIAHDGEVYDVPANYASKSKLVEGDILKLTIRPDGGYIFKQIAPVERKRIVGTLGIDDSSGTYYVMSENRAFKVNPASVSYYKGEVGDEAVLLVPKDGASSWAAVENIIKR